MGGWKSKPKPGENVAPQETTIIAGVKQEVTDDVRKPSNNST